MKNSETFISAASNSFRGTVGMMNLGAQWSGPAIPATPPYQGTGLVSTGLESGSE